MAVVGPEGTAQAHMYALPAGTLLQEFRIEAVLGHGGFGITYRAFDTDLHKAVAIKEYLPNELAGRASDTTVRARSPDDQQQFEQGVVAFLDEARLVARLQHKNIMEVLRFFKANGTGYIVLRYEQGRTLRQRLDEGPLPENELRQLLGGLLDGIEVLHEQAILHRDIKPSNIILSDSRVPGERGVPVLIDFGAARDFRIRHSRSVTTIVAPGYAPPEQYGIGGQAGPWSDLYALGATAYRCVTGQAPPEALRRLRKDPYVPAVEAAAGHYDESLLALIDRLLAVEEVDRPQSAAEVKAALNSRAVLRSRPKPISTRDGRRVGMDAAPARSRRVAGILASVVAAALIAGGAVLWTDGTLPKFLGEIVGKTESEAKVEKIAAAPANDKAVISVPTVAETPKVATVSSTPVGKRSLIDAVAAGFEPVADSGHVGFIYSVAFSPDGRTLASGSLDKTIKLWDVASGQELRTFAGHGDRVTSIAFSPDGRTLASGSLDETIKLWDAASGRELRTLTGHVSSVQRVAFSPDGRTLASGSEDKSIKLWDVPSGRELHTLTGHGSWVSSVTFSPDGRTLASGSWDHTIKLWDVASGQELRAMGHGGNVYFVAFLTDGRTVASWSNDKTIKLWDAASGQELRTLAGHGSLAGSGAISPDGRTLASGWDYKTIELWDVASGQELRTFAGHGDRVTSIAFSPDGRTLASGSWDKTIKLWDVPSGRELRTLTGHGNSVTSVAFSPDGRTLASGSWDNTIKLWDVASGQELRTLKGHKSSVRFVAFSPDGSTLASGSDDDTTKLWDVASGRELRTFTEHGRGVASVAFSPDGRILASGSGIKTIKLWDVANGRELRTLSGFESVHSVAFSPDGRTLASGSDDGMILWSFADGSIQARHIGIGTLGSITLDGKGLPISVSGNEDAVNHFVKEGKVITVSEMRAMGYDLPTPNPKN